VEQIICKYEHKNVLLFADTAAATQHLWCCTSSQLVCGHVIHWW